MATTQCGDPVPTFTRTDVVTSHSLQPTSTTTVTTLPGSVSTVIFRTCSVPAGVTSTCIATATSTLTTLPGSPVTTVIPWTNTVEVPVTNFVTLFSTPCSTIFPDTSTPPPPPPTNTSTPPVTTLTSTSTTTSFSSPVLPTSTPPPTTSDGTTPNPGPSGQPAVKSSNVGPIVGGVVGGVAALVLLGLLTWKYIKSQQRWGDIFDDDDVAPKAQSGHYLKKPSPGGDKPYDYGKLAQGPDHLQDIGHANQAGPDQLGAHNGSNAFGTQDVGPGPAPQPNSAPAMHMRNPSLTPLLAGAAAAAAGLGAGGAAGASSSRPSSSDSSTVPSLGPPPPGPTQNFNANPNPMQNYPPNLQNYMQNQGYITPQPTTNLSHNTSIGSSAPSNYSNSSWGAGSATAYNPGPANIMPVMAAAGIAGGSGAAVAGMSRTTTYQSHQAPSVAGSSNLNTYPPHSNLHHTASYQPSMSSQSQTQSSYSDPFNNRAGSPVSIHDTRVLHIANADPSVYSPENSFSHSGAEASSSGAGPGPNSMAAASSSHVDGKGRPLNLAGEKAALVHLDGGAYQAPEPGTTHPPPGPAPPAYSA